MLKIIDTLKVMTKWVHANNSEKSKLKKNFNKVTEDLQILKDKINLDKNELSFPLSPSHHHPITTSSIPTPNNKSNISNDGEVDQVEE